MLVEEAAGVVDGIIVVVFTVVVVWVLMEGLWNRFSLCLYFPL